MLPSHRRTIFRGSLEIVLAQGRSITRAPRKICVNICAIREAPFCVCPGKLCVHRDTNLRASVIILRAQGRTILRIPGDCACTGTPFIACVPVECACTGTRNFACVPGNCDCIGAHYFLCDRGNSACTGMLYLHVRLEIVRPEGPCFCVRPC
jgi:hypothetical protein